MINLTTQEATDLIESLQEKNLDYLKQIKNLEAEVKRLKEKE